MRQYQIALLQQLYDEKQISKTLRRNPNVHPRDMFTWRNCTGGQNGAGFYVHKTFELHHFTHERHFRDDCIHTKERVDDLFEEFRGERTAEVRRELMESSFTWDLDTFVHLITIHELDQASRKWSVVRSLVRYGTQEIPESEKWLYRPMY
ncbi:hypothetical protein CC2G_004299 [Coprinopsis cinerea AmutBmut pab1-1]|nr:hypothetical protein CC2G_004299 [Coprinopsis cinerea AmutBmut pab1-1]